MPTTILSTTTQAEKSQLFLVKAEELCQDPPPPLPRFCECVRGKSGRQVCQKVGCAVWKLSSAERNAFLFCCRWGLKALVLFCGGRAYVAFAHSPIKDKEHLKRVAPILDVEEKQLNELWEEVPEFNARFVDRVIAELQRRNIVPEDSVLENARILGKAYGPYEFDVILHNTIQRLAPPPSNQAVYCVIKAFNRRDTSRILRILTFRLGGNSSTSDMPIVGLGIPPRVGDDPNEVLDSDYVRSWVTSLQDALYGAESLSPPQGDRGIFPKQESGNSTWTAMFDVFPGQVSSQIAKPYLMNLWVLIYCALHTGFGTAHSRLMDELKNPGLDRWRAFKDRLAEFASFRVHGRDYPSLAARSAEPETAWQMVFGDMLAVCEQLQDDTARRLELELRPVLKDVLELLPTWSGLDLAPPVGANADDRRKTLHADILARGHKYYYMLREAAIRQRLQDGEYSPESVTECLQMDSQTTLGTLYGETRAGRASVLREPGMAGWRTLLKWYEKHAQEDDVDGVRADIYSLGESPNKQLFLEFYSNVLGVLCSVGTLYALPARPLIRGMQVRKYRRFADEALSRM